MRFQISLLQTTRVKLSLLCFDHLEALIMRVKSLRLSFFYYFLRIQRLHNVMHYRQYYLPYLDRKGRITMLSLTACDV